MPQKVKSDIWQIVIYPNGKRPKDVRRGTESDMRKSFEIYKKLLNPGELIVLRNERIEIESFKG